MVDYGYAGGELGEDISGATTWVGVEVRRRQCKRGQEC